MQRLLEREIEMVVDVCDDLGNLMFQVHADRPDLVLLDWELPGRSALPPGAGGAGRWPPVIVLGQQAESEGVALACGARAFVNKAAPRETLLREVHSALNK